MSSCGLCGEEGLYRPVYLEFGGLQGLGFCSRCAQRIEEHHEVDGKFIVDRCPTCDHVKGIKWVPYKKPGPKPEAAQEPKKPENTKELEAFE